MRVILFILVLVNLAWAFWAGAARGKPEDIAAPNTQSLGPGLALLSELSERAPRLPPDVLPPPDLVEDTTATMPESGSDGDDFAVEEKAVATVQVAGALEHEQDEPAGGSEVSANKPEVCVAMGPFDELARVTALRTEILDAGGQAEITREEIEGRPDYLVYIITSGSRPTARLVRDELQAQTIDSHIIAGGDLQNALSVGVFSSEQRARDQYDRVAALGYEAALRPLPRKQTIYHLLADRAAADPSVASRAACHEIASAN